MQRDRSGGHFGKTLNMYLIYHMWNISGLIWRKNQISFDLLLPAVWTLPVCRNEGFGISKAKSKAENQSTFGLERPMEVIFSHAVLHASIILTKRPHIVLTPFWDPFHQDSGRTWRQGDCGGVGGGGSALWQESCHRNPDKFWNGSYYTRLRIHTVRKKNIFLL